MHGSRTSPAYRRASRWFRSATRDACLGSEADASVKGQYHARLPCRGWQSQRGTRYTPGAHRSIGGCRRSGAAASLRRAGQASPQRRRLGGRTSSVAPAFAGRDMRRARGTERSPLASGPDPRCISGRPPSCGNPTAAASAHRRGRRRHDRRAPDPPAPRAAAARTAAGQGRRRVPRARRSRSPGTGRAAARRW